MESQEGRASVVDMEQVAYHLTRSSTADFVFFFFSVILSFVLVCFCGRKEWDSVHEKTLLRLKYSRG